MTPTTLVALWDQQAAATPHRIAIVAGDETVTYAETQRRATHIASRLRQAGIGPESLVGVCMYRSADLVPALLGVLKAGAAYVPLDPGYPTDRLRYMVEHSGVRLVLCDSATTGPTPDLGRDVQVVLADELLDSVDADPVSAGVHPQNLAYVIYTSGSTGRPKGVAVTHASITSFLRSMAKKPGVQASDRVLALTPLSFDISALEMFLPLAVGATVVLAPVGSNTDPAALAATIEEQGVTLVQATPTTWRMLIAWGWAGLAELRMISGGEPLDGKLTQDLLGRGRELWNLYGPTETTVWSAAAQLEEYDSPVAVGSAIDNTGLHVVDDTCRLLGPGEVGELWISGIGLARGYAGRPDLTAQRFVPNPFGAPGERAYRTGDLARWLPDGRLEVLGRADQQVKLRGFRIELGEIEEALRSHPQVVDCVVAVDDTVSGGGRLVAYTTLRGARPEGWATLLRGHLAERLPTYMIPQGYAALHVLPRTPAGKTDRNALRGVAYERVRAERRRAPASVLEQQILDVWSDVLDAGDMSAADDFFAMGGQSLAAVTAASRLREVLGIPVPPNAVFSWPTAAQLARALGETDQPEADTIPLLGPATEPVLSFGQERVLLFERMDTGVPLYNVPLAVSLADRTVDVAALEKALTEIVCRHQVLRTALVTRTGRTCPEIRPVRGVKVPVRDVSAEGLDVAVTDEVRAPFALDSGLLLRAAILRSPEQTILVLTVHHMACDGRSMDLLLHELDVLYRDASAGRTSSLADLPVQYADFARWQRNRMNGEALERGIAYWSEQLAAVSPLELPLDKPRPKVATHVGDRVLFQIPGSLVLRLRSLCLEQGVTLFMGLLAGLQALLGRYAGQHDVAVGTLVGSRTHTQTEDLVGFFVNTVVLRTDLSDDPTWEQLFARVRKVASDAYAHQDVPFERLVEKLQPERDLSRNPLFQVLFAMHEQVQNVPFTDAYSRRELERRIGGARFDLAVDVTDLGDELEVSLEFATDLFERHTIEALGRRLVHVLEQMVNAPQTRLSALELLSAQERNEVLEEWNAPSAPVTETTLVELWQRQVAATPEATAVVAGDERLTFTALDYLATQLETSLRARGVGPETLVGVCLRPSVQLIAALLGVLKAGGAYVPLDPGYPADRLSHMVDASGIQLVVADSETAELPIFGQKVRPVLVDRLDTDAAALEGAGEGALPGNLAYVIYTSGSTGRPKGVAITHANITAFLEWNQRVCRLGPGDRALQNHSVAFDNSVWEIFQCLISGAELHIADATTLYDPEVFLRELENQRITTLNATPSQMRILLEKAPDPARALSTVRLLFTGAEAVPFDVAERILDAVPQDCQVFNEYGPTEATVTSAVCALTPELLALHADRPSVPFGRPTENARLYVLDEFLKPVVPGCRGMLYVGGSAVGRGYLGQPGKTATVYVPDPFGAIPGARMYATGDVVQLLDDGNLVFLGRSDHQVKVRGFRIELGEIEEELRKHPLVSDGVVTVRRATVGGDQLAAYVVPSGPLPDGIAARWREHLADSLPAYMLPQVYGVLTEIPLTPNGKVDRKALPEPTLGGAACTGRKAETAVEKLVSRAWTAGLGLTHEIGLDDNFFDVGGNSLLLAEVAMQLSRELGVKVSPVLLFQHPTIGSLADALDCGPAA
ncbi:amino acid adenylation domain-containing protein [Streptomyces buecherae]|uniref:amino acid adenylation domain-containing protein n=1 Tax=Streptomyces buecherae TaxID=2763006 RepID=UPI0033D4A45A